MSIHRYVLSVSHLWYHHLFLPTHMKENNNANPSIRLQSSNSYKTIFLILNYNLHVLACVNRSLLSPLFNLSDLSMAGAVDMIAVVLLRRRESCIHHLIFSRLEFQKTHQKQSDRLGKKEGAVDMKMGS